MFDFRSRNDQYWIMINQPLLQLLLRLFCYRHINNMLLAYILSFHKYHVIFFYFSFIFLIKPFLTHSYCLFNLKSSLLNILNLIILIITHSINLLICKIFNIKIYKNFQFLVFTLIWNIIYFFLLQFILSTNNSNRIGKYFKLIEI